MCVSVMWEECFIIYELSNGAYLTQLFEEGILFGAL